MAGTTHQQGTQLPAGEGGHHPQPGASGYVPMAPFPQYQPPAQHAGAAPQYGYEPQPQAYQQQPPAQHQPQYFQPPQQQYQSPAGYFGDPYAPPQMAFDPYTGQPLQQQVAQPQQPYYAQQHYGAPQAQAFPQPQAQQPMVAWGGGHAAPSIPMYGAPQPPAPHEQYGAPQQHVAPATGWAYPVPGGGMQVLEPASQQLVKAPKRRVRWENIVPVLAGLAFLVAALLFVKDADELFGGGAAGKDAKATSAMTAEDRSGTGDHEAMSADEHAAMSSGDDAGSTAPSIDVESKLPAAQRRLNAGDFVGTDTLLRELETAAPDNADVQRLRSELDSRRTEHARLVRLAGTQLAAHRWKAALRSLKAAAALQPLSPDLAKMQALASRKAKAAAAAARTSRRPASGGGASSSPRPAPGAVKTTTPSATTATPPTATKPPAAPPKAPDVPAGTPPTGGGAVTGTMPAGHEHMPGMAM